MNDNKWVTQVVKATSTTEVLTYWRRFHGKQPVIRTIEAVGAHASSKLSFYVPKKELEIPIAAAITAVATALYVPVDTAGGHVVRGHTVTTSDFLLIPTSAGLALRAIAAVTDDAGEDYCHLTIVATGKALAIYTKVFLVRAADVFSLTIGSTTASKKDFIAGNAGCPLVVSATSGDATNTIAGVAVEYLSV